METPEKKAEVKLVVAYEIRAPFYLILNEIFIAVSYLVCFISLAALLWMMALGQKVQLSILITFACMSLIFALLSPRLPKPSLPALSEMLASEESKDGSETKKAE
jgi:hypothetical protein